jgi:hypothetical protein
VLAIASNIRGFKPTEDDEWVRAIKIRSTPFFGEKFAVGAMS